MFFTIQAFHRVLSRTIRQGTEEVEDKNIRDAESLIILDMTDGNIVNKCLENSEKT